MGGTLWVWLECIGVVSVCCCKEVYRYPQNNYNFSLLHFIIYRSSFLAAASLLCSLKNIFFHPLRIKIRTKNEITFFTSLSVHINVVVIAMLYTHSFGNQLKNTMVVFKIRDSVPSMRYSHICNILHLR